MVQVLLDAGVLTRCRRRVHLEHDPSSRAVEIAPPNPAAEQRIADARAHREEIARRLRETDPAGWVSVPGTATPAERVAATAEALASGARVISGALLPADTAAGRRGGAELLIRTPAGYVPVIVVRHRISDPGQGARTTALTDLDPDHAATDPERKTRSHPRDQLRLVHLRKLLQAAGHAEPARAVGGVIGLDADVVVWHDLDAPTFPGDRSAVKEYEERFADRFAVASAAANGEPPLAVPSRIVECKQCPWWPTCERDLLDAKDVSLVVRGDDAFALRDLGVSTVAELAVLSPVGEPPVTLTGTTFPHAVSLARAWLSGLSVVRKVPEVSVPRGDVEVDVDMESFSDHGAYLWGALLSGADIGIRPGYRAFATWDPVPTDDEARSFAEFWTWFGQVRARAAERGLTFRAYCYNALAENRWLFASARRFAGLPGIPTVDEVQRFVDSDEWVDLFQSVSESFLSTHGKGLKVLAKVAGYDWQDPEASGEASMRWYREAVGADGGAPDDGQRRRLLRYNEDDVRATYVLREWMTGPAMADVPYVGDLSE
ncbi:MAG: TM0106 family RecB-like putative nuclease, partial [Actinophytocola sp.]|nr:TM0106 family RecB-like putative nuclease [Actinophytocola sp.]